MRKKLIYTLALILLFGSSSLAQDVSFESATVPSDWSSSGGNLSINTDHYKHGTRSLKWNYTPGDQLTVQNLQSQGLNTNEVSDFYTNTLYLWVYNEQAITGDSMVFKFYDNQSTMQYYFPVYLDFYGWRCITLSYLHDMSGPKTSDNLQTMKITGPQTSAGLLFDFVDFTVLRNINKAPDYQLPFVSYYNNVPNHWFNQMYYESLPIFVAPTSPTTIELIDFEAIKLAYDSMILGTAPSSAAVTNANTNFNALNITYSGGIVKGKPLFGYDNPGSENFSAIENFLLVLARDYKHNNTTQSLNQFILTIRHMLDQGYAQGSMVETIHHVGYIFRNIPFAIHLMRDELITVGLWDDARKMVEWYVALESVWDVEAERSDMDEGNTRSVQKLGAALYKPTETEAVQYLKAFKIYMENWLTPRSQSGEGIKPDYSMFHHGIHYPGYSHPALNNIGNCLFYLSSGPTYIPNSSALETFAKCIYSTRVTLGDDDIPQGLCGRNPFQFPNIKSATNQGGLGTSNTNLIAIYNRLYNASIQGIAPEELPQGFWQLNYMPLASYRKNDWVADIKGFNNNFFGAEIYSSDNRYGRYQSYGAIEIIYDGGMTASGYSINGWDWNKIPGATTIHLPWTELVAEQGRLDEKTDATFAGALRFRSELSPYHTQELEGEYGLFGMDFRQKELSTSAIFHDTTFTFKKSVFCFGDYMLCLGSDINNTNSSRPTATNLFQRKFTVSSSSTNINGTSVASLPYNTQIQGTTDSWLIDDQGTGYYIKAGNSIQVQHASQTTPQEDGTGTTTGTMATAWIEHGTAPINAEYEFMILPQTISSMMDTLNPVTMYTVHQQDTKAHIAEDLASGMIGYAVFKTDAPINTSGYVDSVNVPSLIMEQLTGQMLNLTIVDPNIIFDPVSGISQTTQTDLWLNGEWSLYYTSGGATLISSGNSKTHLSFSMRDGLPEDIILCQPVYTSIAESNCGSFDFNGQILTVSGIYTSTLSAASGCDSIITLDLTILTDPDISISSNNLELSAASGQDSYQWINCTTGNAVSGAISQNYTVTTNGSYGCVVTLGGCSDTTDCINIDNVGIEDLDLKAISVYPSPASDQITIAFPTLSSGKVRITDISGKVLIQTSFSEKETINIPVQTLSPGNYLIEIQGDSGSTVRQIIKN